MIDDRVRKCVRVLPRHRIYASIDAREMVAPRGSLRRGSPHARDQLLPAAELSVECIDCRPKAFRGTSDSICSGDSGGPALDLGGVIIGVASASGVGCTASYYNRVDPHGAFLRKTVRDETGAAGIAAPPWTNEPPADAGVVDAAAPAPSEPAVPVVEDEPAPPPAAPPPAESGCVTTTRSPRGVDGLAAVVLVAIAGWMRAVRARARAGKAR